VKTNLFIAFSLIPYLYIYTWRSQAIAQSAPTPGVKRRLWVEGWIGQPLNQWDRREKRPVPENTPPTKQMQKLREGLRKAEIALLTQAHTGMIRATEIPAWTKHA